MRHVVAVLVLPAAHPSESTMLVARARPECTAAMPNPLLELRFAWRSGWHLSLKKSCRLALVNADQSTRYHDAGMAIRVLDLARRSEV